MRESQMKNQIGYTVQLNLQLTAGFRYDYVNTLSNLITYSAQAVEISGFESTRAKE